MRAALGKLTMLVTSSRPVCMEGVTDIMYKYGANSGGVHKHRQRRHIQGQV